MEIKFAMELELKEVVKTVRGKTHIYPTSLTFKSGDFNILLGTTGSGKTTLMQIMAGLESIDSGSIYFDGKDVTKVSVQKRNISMVYQSFINYPNFSVFDNIASPLYVTKFSEVEIKKRVGDIAELLKLSPLLDRNPSELSGGQQQRTAMARALVKDSSLVLLDEPLANLDYKLREELRDELPQLLAKRNSIVVYSTTEPLEALLFGGNTATLHEGKVVQFGPTNEVYQYPNNLISAQVFSEPIMNQVKVIKKGNELFMQSGVKWQLKGKTANLQDGEYAFGIRPHHFKIGAKNDGFIRISGTVDISEISGSDSVIHFKNDDGFWIVHLSGIHSHSFGNSIELYMDTTKGILFDDDGNAILN